MYKRISPLLVFAVTTVDMWLSTRAQAGQRPHSATSNRRVHKRTLKKKTLLSHSSGV
jgi:hypothetical protein